MPTDERVEGLKQRIYKEAYFVAIGICLISLLSKTMVLDLEIETALVESLVLIVSGLYFAVRSIALGVVADEAEMQEQVSRWSMDRKMAVLGLVAGFITAVGIGIRSAAVYGDDTTWLWYFFLVFVTAFIMYVPFLVLALVFGTKLVRKASEKAAKRDRA